jgi:hypothetical protein
MLTLYFSLRPLVPAVLVVLVAGCVQVPQGYTSPPSNVQVSNPSGQVTNPAPKPAARTSSARTSATAGAANVNEASRSGATATRDSTNSSAPAARTPAATASSQDVIARSAAARSNNFDMIGCVEREKRPVDVCQELQMANLARRRGDPVPPTGRFNMMACMREGSGDREANFLRCAELSNAARRAGAPTASSGDNPVPPGAAVSPARTVTDDAPVVSLGR